MQRPSFDNYFRNIVEVVASRSTCKRHHFGAVIVKDRRILCTGYNGSPVGFKNCDEHGCMRNDLGIVSGTRQEMCMAVHAETNAIAQAALHGISIKGATLYVNGQPCSMCLRLMINAGISRLVYWNPYPDEFSVELMKMSNLEIVVLDDDIEPV